MVNIDVLGLIVTIIIVVIALFLVPTMLQLRGTAQRVDELIRDAQRDLLPLLHNLRETSEMLKEMTETAREGVERGANLLQAIGEVGDSIHGVNAVLNQITGKYVSRSAGLLMGARAAARVFLDRMKKKGEN